MPYRSATGGFTGNSNVATFMDQVVVPFMTDAKASGGLGWISQTPSRGKGTTPNFEFILSRGGVGTEAAPFFMCQTTAKTLFMYSGDGVNVNQESFDQPGNPMNCPDADPPGDPGTTFGLLKCLAMTTMVGSYDSYWVFGGPTGEYCHVVLKVGARQYRHFHIGILDRFNTDLPADTFYITNHRWAHLGPDNLNSQYSPTYSATSNYEHRPYYANFHILPFRNNTSTNTSFTGGYHGDLRSKGMWLHVPGGYGTLGYEWWLSVGVDGIGGVSGRVRATLGNQGNPTAVTKPVGDVNNGSDAVSFGAMTVGGYDSALGTVPWACEPTFTTDGIALVPITVLLPSDFESDIRWAPVGQVPDVFRVNMKSLDAEQEITIGSDTYTVFPLINNDANNTVDGEGYSGYEGLAYKKITANAT